VNRTVPDQGEETSLTGTIATWRPDVKLYDMKRSSSTLDWKHQAYFDPLNSLLNISNEQLLTLTN